MERQYTKLKMNRGFTLIETFVAISIMLVAITGPLTIATKGLQSSLLARDQITAFYLAQEAVEYIRYKRDSNFLNGFGGAAASWLDGLSDCMGGKTCIVDSIEDTVTTCPGGICTELLYDSPFYTYTSSPSSAPSLYTRSVVMTEIVANTEYSITVTVAWSTGEFDRSIQVKEHISNILDL